MAINFPSAAELRDELDPQGTSRIQAATKDSSWGVKLKDNDDLDSADVHDA